MPTGVQIRQDVADVLFEGRRHRRGTTTSGGGALTIIDSSLAEAGIVPHGLIDAILLITSGGQDGNSRRISAFDRTTGTITVAAAFGGTPGSGVTYELFYDNFDPDDLLTKINEVIREVEAPYLWAPSLVTQADMGDADLANYPEVGSTTTRVFVTTAQLTFFGERAIHVVTDALTEGIQTLVIPVTQNERIIASTPVSVEVGSCIVSIYDNVGAAAIGDSVTVPVAAATIEGDERTFAEARIARTIQGSVTDMRLRFVSGVAASTFYISPYVIAQSSWRRAYTVPSWLVSKKQIVDLVSMPLGQPHGADVDVYLPLSARLKALADIQFVRSDIDLRPLRMMFGNPTDRPVLVKAKRPLPEIATAATTTTCDRKYAALRVLSKLIRARGGGWGRWDRDADRRARQMGYGGRDLRSREVRVGVV